jgi:hypothetical protein
MNRNTAIIATVVTSLLCGCPGIFACFWGAIAASVSFVPGATIDIGGSSDPTSALITGLGSICGGLLFIVIPVVVGVLTFRNAKVA